MRANPQLSALVLLLSLGAIAMPGCNCGVDPLERPVPHMNVTPKQVVLDGVPVAQDTRIVVRVTNDSIVNLPLLTAHLADGADPAFTLEPDFPAEVFAGQTAEIIIIVRPLLANTINAVLVIDGPCGGAPCTESEQGAKPADHVEVPIVVNAIDAGLPDICDYPEGVQFGLVGQNDVARETVPMKNCGVRDLLIDEVFFCATPAAGETPDARGCGADVQIRLNTALDAGQPLPPNSALSVELLFRPLDLEEHTGDLVIMSNDPDENPVIIPVVGRGSACPIAVAELVDGPDFEPFDIVRIDGSNSIASNSTVPGSFLGRFEWSPRQRPVGSIETPNPDDGVATEIAAELAGRYIVALDVFETVFDSNGVLQGEVRSCEPALVTFDVVPTEELLIQLVWDHADADLDLHLVRAGGDVFTHEDDCYFSNREPQQTVDEPLWSVLPEENPVLDVDDNRGYGPENLNIVAPAPNSQWQVLVHYWNKQTDLDPRTTATVRVFVYGVQTMEITRTFEDEEFMWQALDITWPAVEGDAPSISQLGIVEPFPRPF